MQMQRNALYSGLLFSPNLLSECLTHSQSNRRDRHSHSWNIHAESQVCVWSSRFSFILL